MFIGLRFAGQTLVISNLPTMSIDFTYIPVPWQRNTCALFLLQDLGSVSSDAERVRSRMEQNEEAGLEAGTGREFISHLSCTFGSNPCVYSQLALSIQNLCESDSLGQVKTPRSAAAARTHLSGHVLTKGLRHPVRGFEACTYESQISHLKNITR